jgi:hypothetical protein
MLRATLLTVLLSAPLLAQARPKAEVCPYCKNDGKLMAAAGVVSHGPLPIGKNGSDDLEKDSKPGTWLFLETAHIRWAFSLGGCSVDGRDKERVEAELQRLRKALPAVPSKTPRLDPFLRLHLLAMRGEEFHARFQKLLQVSDADFPEQRVLGEKYMGAGKFLGEKDKFEVVVHKQRSTHFAFTRTFSGATVTDALRWHIPVLHKMVASLPAEDADLREDRNLFPHTVHNLSHLFFCAYKHFAFDPPYWLDEGLAHCMEKEADPTSSTFEGEEGASRDTKAPADWYAAVKKLIGSGKALSFAELLHAKGFSDLTVPAQMTGWSMVRFLIDEHPDKFAQFLGAVKGQLDEQGNQSGKDLPDLQRKLLMDLWGWTPASFTEAWKAWALKAK